MPDVIYDHCTVLLFSLTCTLSQSCPPLLTSLSSLSSHSPAPPAPPTSPTRTNRYITHQIWNNEAKSAPTVTEGFHQIFRLSLLPELVTQKNPTGVVEEGGAKRRGMTMVQFLVNEARKFAPDALDWFTEASLEIDAAFWKFPSSLEEQQKAFEEEVVEPLQAITDNANRAALVPAETMALLQAGKLRLKTLLDTLPATRDAFFQYFAAIHETLDDYAEPPTSCDGYKSSYVTKKAMTMLMGAQEEDLDTSQKVKDQVMLVKNMAVKESDRYPDEAAAFHRFINYPAVRSGRRENAHSSSTCNECCTC